MLITINLILIWIVLIFLVIIPFINRFTIRIRKTVWSKKAYGIEITKWENSRYDFPNVGEVIFTYNWIDPRKIDKLK